MSEGQQVGRVYPAQGEKKGTGLMEPLLDKALANIRDATPALAPHPWRGMTIAGFVSEGEGVEIHALPVVEAIGWAKACRGAQLRAQLHEGDMLAALRAADEWFKQAGVE